jgi:hypothetical protein
MFQDKEYGIDKSNVYCPALEVFSLMRALVIQCREGARRISDPVPTLVGAVGMTVDGHQAAHGSPIES